MDVTATACLQSVSIDCNLTEKVMGCILRQNQVLDLITSVSTELLHSTIHKNYSSALKARS